MNTTCYKIVEEKHSKEYIEENKLFNVFVFGLPRTGTSMMTHICELLGVNMIHTSEENKNSYDHLGKDYHPNESGFFEITKDSMKHFFKIASTPYSGCKMIIPVQDLRFDLVKMLPSKVIMMWRNPEEIRQSRNGFKMKPVDKAFLRSALVDEDLKLKEEKIDYLRINYRDVIKFPKREITKIKDFILSDEDISEAVDSVNSGAYRFDIDKITVGV